jgi:hypothetical protein
MTRVSTPAVLVAHPGMPAGLSADRLSSRPEGGETAEAIILVGEG